ncbi:Protein of unknown function (DUF2680) [Desulfosporosinus orientis DSM 765]|uniref:DUF2680 domain-containing protein n=1 Tax=Desulfosporosinus orientis (strain ATCC 19365 / DSM 765 / NCIMB 8382 / VKM B-1628 / Singapore I) TaxID=768706 RepID=G7WGZ3_DESOD|nr:DUF2680 domain-containing protein [Desulfosporosinus orientis]AET69007.1 Protein of unknown function (DUF2680) [Desulfosporosinus orientis DSM 765]
MKKIKTYLIAAAVVVMLGITGTAFASATLKTPAEITAGLTGKTIEQVTQERTSGKTYGAIADEADKLDEFKAQILEQKKALLDQRVADGILTQDQANSIYDSLKTNQAICDGTGTSGIGRSTGLSLGIGQGQGMGQGIGRNGRNAAQGRGNNFRGMGNGTCLNY